MKRLVAIFIILVLTCFLFAGCDIVDSAIDGVDASKHNIHNAIIGLFSHTHNYEENIVTPTCENQGYTTFTCECGESYVNDYVDALGHTEVIDAAVPATCTTAGLTEGKHCSVCGLVIVAQQTLEVSHNYENHVCKVCGAMRQSKGLEYTSNRDGTCYISGIGTCTDTDIIIPSVFPNGEKVIGIGGSAFKDCSSLTSVTIPNSVTYIGAGAFSRCTGLTSIIIPDGVTTIGDSAFSGCSNLASVVIPKSITEIMGWFAFSGLHEDLAAYYKGTIAECSHIKAHRPSNEDLHRAPHYYYSETEPTEMGNFWHYVDGVPTVWEDYISYSIGLDYQEIDGSYTSYALVGIGSFEGTELVIPAEYNNCPVVSINSQAFMNQTQLVSVVIPETIVDVGAYAFNGCTSLTSIDVDSDNAYYKSIDGNLYTKDGKTIVQYAIGKKDITFAIPDGVTSIGDYAFYNCSNLRSITIPGSVTSIGRYVFSDCTSLTSVTIGNSVTSIDDCVFYGCSSLTSIDVDSDNAYYKSIDGNLYTKDGKTIVQYAIGKKDITFAIPDGVTSIGRYAFSGCTSLANVTIPDSVTYIDYCAFAYCSSLTSITIPDSVTHIGFYAFEDCTILTTINYCGTEEEWNAISKSSYWDDGAGNYTIVYNYNG